MDGSITLLRQIFFFNDCFLLFQTFYCLSWWNDFVFVLCSVGVYVLNQNHVHNLHKESEWYGIYYGKLSGYMHSCMSLLCWETHGHTKLKSMDKQSLLIFTFDHIPALPVFVHRQFVVFVLRVTKLAYVNLLCACLLTAAAHVSTHLSEFFLCFTLVWEPRGSADHWGLWTNRELVLSMEGKKSKGFYRKCLAK